MKKLLFVTTILIGFNYTAKSQSMRDTVSRADKLYALAKIWKEADYNFAFFDRQPQLNWDSVYMAYIPKILATRNLYEYAKVLRSFVATLKDGHTSLFQPQFYWNDIDSPPINTVNLNGKKYVVSVDETYKNLIPIGSEITRYNGKIWDDFISDADLENNDWYGFRNTTLELTILSPDKKESKVVVKRNTNELFRAKTLKLFPAASQPVSHKSVEFKQLSPQTAYVAINTFADSTIVSDFERLLPEIRKYKNLIFDIRENTGGNDDYAVKVAKHLTDKPFILGAMWMTRTNNAAEKAWAAADDKLTNYLKNSWDKHTGDTIQIPKTIKRLNMPVYVLTSKKTFSAAEDFLIYLNGSKNITRIGQTSAGSSGQPLLFTIPKGFSVRICAKHDALPDGTEFVGVGIKPDIYVEPFFSFTGETKDVELAKALEVIAAKK